VAFDGFAQGGLADPDRGVARDGERHRGDADGQQGELGQQLHGVLQVKPFDRRVKPSASSQAHTVVCPLPVGVRPTIVLSLCRNSWTRGTALSKVDPK
jgi:hypothetical protein